MSSRELSKLIKEITLIENDQVREDTYAERSSEVAKLITELKEIDDKITELGARQGMHTKEPTWLGSLQVTNIYNEKSTLNSSLSDMQHIIRKAIRELQATSGIPERLGLPKPQDQPRNFPAWPD